VNRNVSLAPREYRRQMLLYNPEDVGRFVTVNQYVWRNVRLLKSGAPARVKFARLLNLDRVSEVHGDIRKLSRPFPTSEGQMA
jgi:hypothetical protein